jgi:hypothetical protein
VRYQITDTAGNGDYLTLDPNQLAELRRLLKRIRKENQ